MSDYNTRLETRKKAVMNERRLGSLAIKFTNDLKPNYLKKSFSRIATKPTVPTTYLPKFIEKKLLIECLTSFRTTFKKCQRNLKTPLNYSLVPSLPPKITILPILAKNYWEIGIECFPQCTISHKFESLSQKVCLWLSLKTVFGF